MRKNISRAFSLMELLVSISIIGVLTSLAVAGIGAARTTARQLKCKTNIRNAGQAIMTYAAEHKDYFPFAGYERRTWPDDLLPDAVKGISVVMGGQSGLRHGLWSVMFPEQWSGIEFSPSMKCPGQPEYNRAGLNYLSDSPFPYYFLSSAMWLAEQDMAVADSALRAKAKPHHVGEITYPSHKSLFFEQAAFCNTGSDLAMALNLGQTPEGKISVVFGDLSVSRFSRMDGTLLPPPGQAVLPFDFTPNGVRGRDCLSR